MNKENVEMSEINKISKMSFSELLKIEFMKCKRSKIPDFYCPFACGFFWNCEFKQLFHTRIYKCMARYVHSKRTCLRILSVAL